MLEFCPMCRGLLIQKEERGILMGVCSCGFKRTAGIEISGENNSEIKKIRGEGVSVGEDRLASSVEKLCLKCGFDRASVFEIAASEANIFVFSCLKCSATQREVQGISRA